MSPTADGSGAIAPGSTDRAEFEADTRAHRQLYWTTEPAELIATVTGHIAAGRTLPAGAAAGADALPAADADGAGVAAAVAESLLLVGRLELLGRHDPEAARPALQEARTTAVAAGEPLLAAAALGLLALVPADGRAEAAAESFTAARSLLAHAGTGAAGLLDWLEAVEAERANRDGEHEKAIRLISRVEGARVRSEDRPFPPWLDWCTTARIGILKGRIQLAAGLVAQARRTLLYAMATVRPDDHGQRSLIYAGLAAVEAADGQAYESCGYACRALEHIEAGGDVMGVRAGLEEYLHDSCVQDLYESLAFSPSESVVPAGTGEVTRRGTSAGRAPGIR
ncbi:hypothetical protein ACIQ9E_03605 [Streptomyces sp. NPDC094448]|uniref:hypothetical protein n=1 Tax=Streptomyces sp. NPDC094448 TaxID=3366063 RepID=UPI0038160BE4